MVLSTVCKFSNNFAEYKKVATYGNFRVTRWRIARKQLFVFGQRLFGNLDIVEEDTTCTADLEVVLVVELIDSF